MRERIKKYYKYLLVGIALLLAWALGWLACRATTPTPAATPSPTPTATHPATAMATAPQPAPPTPSLIPTCTKTSEDTAGQCYFDVTNSTTITVLPGCAVFFTAYSAASPVPGNGLFITIYNDTAYPQELQFDFVDGAVRVRPDLGTAVRACLEGVNWARRNGFLVQVNPCKVVNVSDLLP